MIVMEQPPPKWMVNDGEFWNGSFPNDNPSNSWIIMVEHSFMVSKLWLSWLSWTLLLWLSWKWFKWIMMIMDHETENSRSWMVMKWIMKPKIPDQFSTSKWLNCDNWWFMVSSPSVNRWYKDGSWNIGHDGQGWWFSMEFTLKQGDWLRVSAWKMVLKGGFTLKHGRFVEKLIQHDK